MNIHQIYRSKFIKITVICFISIFHFSFGEMLECETANFRIIYDSNLSREATILFSRVENLSKNVLEKLDFKPYKKFNIYLLPNNVENAYVSMIYPRNIYIYPNTLMMYEKPFEEWIPFVFVHEFTHAVMGSSSLFAIILPYWIHEGAAVYFESYFGSGRGKSNLFLNIPNSFDYLSPKLFYYDRSLAYTLGYHYLKSYECYLSETDLHDALKRGIHYPILFSLDNFKNDFKYHWNDFKKMKIIVGKKVNNYETTALASYGDYLYAYCILDDHKYILKMDFLNKSKSFDMISNFKFFDFFDNNKIVIKYLFLQSHQLDQNDIRLNTAAYINGKFFKKGLKIAVKSGDEIFYVNREYGKEELISTVKGLLINKDQNIIFQSIMIYKDILFFCGSNYYKPGIFLYKLIEGKIVEICPASDCSTYEDKIYFVRDIEDQIGIYEYNINENKVYELVRGDTLHNPVKVRDKLFFLQYDEGLEYVYELEMSALNKKEVHNQPKLEDEKQKIIKKPLFSFSNFKSNKNKQDITTNISSKDEYLNFLPYKKARSEFKVEWIQINAEEPIGDTEKLGFMNKFSISQPISNEYIKITPKVKFYGGAEIEFSNSFWSLGVSGEKNQISLVVGAYLNKFIYRLNFQFNSGIVFNSKGDVKLTLSTENDKLSSYTTFEYNVMSFKYKIASELKILKKISIKLFEYIRYSELVYDQYDMFLYVLLNLVRPEGKDKFLERDESYAVSFSFYKNMKLLNLDIPIFYDANLYLDDISCKIKPEIIIKNNKCTYIVSNYLMLNIGVSYLHPFTLYFKHIYIFQENAHINAFCIGASALMWMH